mmetsp:Transcript_20743/g.31611  ORF Transcript_20743/g.31611 Transcript_20743/m.31611 type:complete len:325 (-) Transcript_20743:1948-2922(-)
MSNLPKFRTPPPPPGPPPGSASSVRPSASSNPPLPAGVGTLAPTGIASASTGSMNVPTPSVWSTPPAVVSTRQPATTAIPKSPSHFMFGGGGGGHPNNKSVVWKIPPSMPAINDTHSSSGISACVPTSGTERVQLDHKYQSTSVLLDVEEDIGGSSFMRRTISVFLPVILVTTHQFLRTLLCKLFSCLNSSLLLCDIQHLLQSIVYRVVLFLVTSSIWNLSSFGLFLYVCWRVVVTYSSTSTGLPRFWHLSATLRSCLRLRPSVLPNGSYSLLPSSLFEFSSSFGGVLRCSIMCLQDCVLPWHHFIFNVTHACPQMSPSSSSSS